MTYPHERAIGARLLFLGAWTLTAATATLLGLALSMGIDPLMFYVRTGAVCATVAFVGYLVDRDRIPAGDIYQAGVDVGYERGIQAGRRAQCPQRPVVVPIRQRRRYVQADVPERSADASADGPLNW